MFLSNFVEGGQGLFYFYREGHLKKKFGKPCFILTQKIVFAVALIHYKSFLYIKTTNSAWMSTTPVHTLLLSLDLVPPPHVTVHSDHSPNSPKPGSTPHESASICFSPVHDCTRDLVLVPMQVESQALYADHSSQAPGPASHAFKVTEI